MGESTVTGAPSLCTAVYPVQSLFPHLGSLNLQKNRRGQRDSESSRNLPRVTQPQCSPAELEAPAASLSQACFPLPALLCLPQVGSGRQEAEPWGWVLPSALRHFSSQ